MDAPYAVVVLQNDPSLHSGDGTFITPNETTEMVDCLRVQGLTVVLQTVIECDMAGALAPYSPDQWLVLNLCEDWNGDATDYATPAQLITDLGFSSCHRQFPSRFRAAWARALPWAAARR